jgi:hypothetical protein
MSAWSKRDVREVWQEIARNRFLDSVRGEKFLEFLFEADSLVMFSLSFDVFHRAAVSGIQQSALETRFGSVHTLLPRRLC